MESSNLTVNELIEATKEELIRNGYKDLALIGIERVWRNLEEYLATRNLDHFSIDVGLKFLEDRYHFSATQKTSSSNNARLRAINLLEDFQAHKTISIRRKSKQYKFSPQFEEVFNRFIDFRKSSGLSGRTIESDKIYLKKLSEYLSTQKVQHVEEIDVPQINGFFNSYAATYKTPTVYCTACLLRSLFRYLYDENVITKNLALFVPKVKSVKKSKVPSAYSEEEIQRLLESVDRGSPKGKRDYAILLIASRLGIRATDICELTFDSFRWEANTIELRQSKTGEPIVLPLLNDVGEAVIDYIKYGRPVVETKVIFLRLSAPIDCMKAPTLHSIVTHYMNKANISIQEGKKHGPHSLRHSLASALLNNNTPMPVISEILGHTNSDTTSIYLKIDILHLRDYSLDVPPLSSFWLGGDV